MVRIFLLLLLLASISLRADQWKVTTWNLEWFPSGKPDFVEPALEAKRTKEAADILRTIDPDVILLQEVRDEAAVQALAKAIGRGHEVVVVSRFKQGNRIGQQQQAILAKVPATAAYWREWTTRQLVNPPRGYAFAVFATPSGAKVGVYSVHLKSNAMGRDVKDRDKQTILNRLQRELAAEQIVEHMKEVFAIPDIAPAAVVVGGDFNTDPTQERFATERTIPTLTEAGFLNPLSPLPLAKRTTIPRSGRYPDTTFDYLLFKSVKVHGEPSIVSTTVSDHRPVTFTVTVP